MRNLIDQLSKVPLPRWPAPLIWASIWLVLLLADPWIDLANLSLILLVGSVAASLWVPPLVSIVVSTGAVIAFNWLFVPPRGSFHVDTLQHLILLLTMAIVNGLIALLMDLHRRAAIRINDQRTRNTLLMSVSHDFRTPLSVIIGQATALQERCQSLNDSGTAKMAGVIYQQSSRLSHIVDNVLQLVRLDSQAVRLNKDWESPEELIGHAVQLSRQRASGRQITAFASPDLPLLWCDAVLVIQLLENLIDNAVKYSPENESISVSTGVLDGKICFMVEDRGAGVPEAIKEHLAGSRWNLGAPLSRVASDVPAGGIGLSLCEAIARLHGTTLKVKPRDGGGSVFMFCMPVRENLVTPAEDSL